MAMAILLLVDGIDSLPSLSALLTLLFDGRKGILHFVVRSLLSYYRIAATAVLLFVGGHGYPSFISWQRLFFFLCSEQLSEFCLGRGHSYPILVVQPYTISYF